MKTQREPKIHYIAMGGEIGCLPDNCQSYDDLSGAVDSLVSLYELSKRQARELKSFDITYLNPDQGGAYCEIIECRCNNPNQHNDN
jgi:hypothetical protein